MSQLLPPRLQKLLRKPATAVVISLSAVLAGGIASLFASQIRAAFPFNWVGFGGYNGPSWPAIGFWVALLSFACLFWARQWAVDRQQQQRQDKLVEESKALRTLVRTMPPEGFLDLFTMVFRECEEFVPATVRDAHANPGSIEAEEIKDSVRRVLDGVVVLAKEFDGGPDGVTYAANIMRYIPADDLGCLPDHLHFAPDDCVPKLQGILNLELELSTTSATDSLNRDDALDALALPIPETNRKDGRWRVLPGGPMSFVTNRLDGYRDSSTLGKWCREEGDFRESTCAAVDDYFQGGKGDAIRSFVSLPLSEAGAAQPLGILNLHRDKVGMLEERNPATHFAPITLPFRSMLVELLRALAVVERTSGNPKTGDSTSQREDSISGERE